MAYRFSFYSLFLLVLSSFFIISCKSTTEEPKDITFGTAYFPLQQGQFQTFVVRQQIFALNEPVQNNNYQLKEVIGEEFISEGGEPAFEILRYERANGLENFVLDSVFSVRKNQKYVVKTEHNVPYVKMNFPLEEGKSWDGNLFNTRPKKDFVVENIGQRITINGQDFPSTLTIYESQDSSLVSKNLRYEIYAENVGLIYKRTEELVYCNQPECFGQKIIERGIISELSIFDWGVQQ